MDISYLETKILAKKEKQLRDELAKCFSNAEKILREAFKGNYENRLSETDADEANEWIASCLKIYSYYSAEDWAGIYTNPGELPKRLKEILLKSATDEFLKKVEEISLITE